MAAFLDGNLSASEMKEISSRINNNEDLTQFVEASDNIDDSIESYCLSNCELPEEIASTDFEIPHLTSLENLLDEGDIFDPLPDSMSINEDIIHETHNEDMTDKSNPVFKGLTVDDIQQQYPDTCAIKSQQIILESHDIDVSEDELVMESIEKGWYTPGEGGTKPTDVGNLLEDHGLTVNRYEHATIDDIAAELAKGHQVIVGVDSGELWEPGRYESLEDFLHISGADHALIVSGIQINPLTAEREVVLTDPGTGEIAHTYSVEQFEDAWDDSDNFMVTSEY